MAPRKEKADKTSNNGGGNAEGLIVEYLSKFISRGGGLLIEIILSLEQQK